MSSGRQSVPGKKKSETPGEQCCFPVLVDPFFHSDFSVRFSRSSVDAAIETFSDNNHLFLILFIPSVGDAECSLLGSASQ
tara:strand:- start:683 stop:922 length:240 start_codon:yes stop_codon:yes gene_type:complete